jgi:hypothetical protein
VSELIEAVLAIDRKVIQNEKRRARPADEISTHEDTQAGVHAMQASSTPPTGTRCYLAEDRIDANEFFAENYITQGMRLLLTEGFRRLEGRSEVFKLAQAMGGGKMHNLITFGLLRRHPGLWPLWITEMLSPSPQAPMPSQARYHPQIVLKSVHWETPSPL